MNSNIENSQDNCVMTLRDIVDFINQKRGVKKGDKGFKRHSQALFTIEKLASEAPNFGGAKYLTLNYNGQKFKTLHFTAKQSIAVGAKLDNGLLMDVIDKVEELEGKTPKPSLTYSKADVYIKIVENNQNVIKQNNEMIKQNSLIITALENEESAQLVQIAQEEPEMIEAIEYIEEKKEFKKSKVTRARNTKSRFYGMPSTNLYDLPLENGVEGIVVFEYHSPTRCGMKLEKANQVFLIPLPRWSKDLLDFAFLKAEVRYSRSDKKARFDLIRVIEKN